MALFGGILTLNSKYGTIVFIAVLFFILLFEGGIKIMIPFLNYFTIINFYNSSALGAIESICEVRGLQVFKNYILIS